MSVHPPQSPAVTAPAHQAQKGDKYFPHYNITIPPLRIENLMNFVSPSQLEVLHPANAAAASIAAPAASRISVLMISSV